MPKRGITPEIVRTYEKSLYSYLISPTHLRIQKIKKLMQTGGKILNSTVDEEIILELKEISRKELLLLRFNRKKAGFVLKIKSSYYYCEIPKSIRFSALHSFKLTGFENNSNKHMCANNCRHLSAEEDCNGGCAKIRDSSVHELYRHEGFPFKQALLLSERIEKYDFIEFGFETFNTRYDASYVIECANYKG